MTKTSVIVLLSTILAGGCGSLQPDNGSGAHDPAQVTGSTAIAPGTCDQLQKLDLDALRGSCDPGRVAISLDFRDCSRLRSSCDEFGKGRIDAFSSCLRKLSRCAKGGEAEFLRGLGSCENDLLQASFSCRIAGNLVR